MYLGIDDDDPFFTRADVIRDIEKSCPVPVRVFRYGDTQNRPVRAWNRLFQAAYEDGNDYFFQCGDDVCFLVPDCISEFVNTLRQMGDLGAVGPRQIGNEQVLTHSCVSRKHMELFGFYFPDEFKNWYCDNWLTESYRNAGRCVISDTITIENAVTAGSHARYQIDHAARILVERLDGSPKIKNRI